MIRKIFPLAALISIGISAAAKDKPELATEAIPAGLKTDAHMVVRYDSTIVTIEKADKIIHTHKYAYTILDKEGKSYAMLALRYNLQEKISDISGGLYDKDGSEIRQLKEKDVLDYSDYVTGSSFHSDARRKQYDFNYTQYPYTVVFEVEEIIRTAFFLPDWVAQPDNDCSVQKTTFILSYKDDVPVRYKEYLMQKDVIRKESGSEGGKTICWTINNIPAYKEQPYARTGNFNSPTVILSPAKFEFMDYKGDMSTWKDLGAFVYLLNENRDSLPVTVREKVHALVDGETDAYKKIQKLYTYMQENTRYVANVYGLAGWQTFDAANVARNGYGDCKGLTNYLKAMLKEAGIRSYAAIVYAGDNYYRLDEQFPANVFNHVILCVPQAKDSLWVECTSQQLPAGYLGEFTQDRQVLLTTENGGFICRTPAYGKDKSNIARTANMQLDNTTRQQKIHLKNRYYGLTQDDLQYRLKTQSQDKTREMVNGKFSFPSYSVTRFDYSYGTGKDHVPYVEEEVDADVSGIISSTQKRTFVNLGWMRNPMTEIFQTEARTLPFVLRESFRITDSVIVDLPAGVEIESFPKATDIQHPFAEYHIRFEKQDNKLMMIRTFEQNEGTYEVKYFEEYQKMYQVINTAKDNLNVVLLNKAS